MSQERNQAAFESLEAAQRRFTARMRKFAEGERWRRGWDRSKEFCAEAARAAQYLELAADALDAAGREAGGETRADGWLSRSLHGLARYLTIGATSEEPADNVGDLVELARRGEGFSGDCRVMELPDLVGMLRAQQKTGVLLVRCPGEVIHLHFQSGELVHAFSESCPTELRLGEVLVQMGCISRERLDSLLFCHASSPRLLGDILVEGGLVHPTHLQQALVYQIQRLFDRLFQYKDKSSFHFDPGLPPVPSNRARLNVLQLLLDSARIADEGSRAAEDEGLRAESFDPPTQLMPDSLTESAGPPGALDEVDAARESA